MASHSKNPATIVSVRSSEASSDRVLPSRFKGSTRGSRLSKQRFSVQNEDLNVIDDEKLLVKHFETCKLAENKPKTPSNTNERS